MSRTASKTNRCVPSVIPVLQRDWHLAVSQWGRWTHPAGYRHPAIIISSNVLFWVETGAATFCLPAERVLLKAGMLALVPANRAFYYQVAAGPAFRHCTVHFDMHTGSGVSLAQLGVIPRCVTAPDPRRVAELFALIERDIGKKQLTAHLRVCSVVWQLLTMMSDARRSKEPRLGQPHGKAYEAMALIEANFRKPISIKEIADTLRITPDYLSTIFDQTFGISPKLQISHLRTIHAYSLLVTTDKSVKEIAYEVGFQNPNVFERAFHRAFRYSPQEVRSKQMPSVSGPTFSYRPRKKVEPKV